MAPVSVLFFQVKHPVFGGKTFLRSPGSKLHRTTDKLWGARKLDSVNDVFQLIPLNASVKCDYVAGRTFPNRPLIIYGLHLGLVH